jgi:hypothetical protein
MSWAMGLRGISSTATTQNRQVTTVSNPTGMISTLRERERRGGDAALVLLFSLLVSGQIKLRRIDGWRKIAAVLTRLTPAAA